MPGFVNLGMGFCSELMPFHNLRFPAFEIVD